MSDRKDLIAHVRRAADALAEDDAVVTVVLAEAARRCVSVAGGDVSKVARVMFEASARTAEYHRAAAAAAGVEEWRLLEWCRESAAIRAGVRRGEVKPDA